nr:MAG TPA: hypothetical protein [Caudoviricetes sp.]
MMWVLSKATSSLHVCKRDFLLLQYNLHIMPLNFGPPVFRQPENLYGVCGIGNDRACLVAGESTPP